MKHKKYFDTRLPITNDSKKLAEYLMEQSDREHLRVFYMDERHYLLAEEVYDIFKIDETAIYTRKLMEQGLRVGASSMIVSHNYPEREAPTEGDVSIVRKLVIACPSVEIDLVDYKTVTEYGCFSFKKQGLIQEGYTIIWKDEVVWKDDKEYKNAIREDNYKVEKLH
ncbi:JAB domain-containing protein [Wolbachia endosymbiont (group A) of Pogonocherus hispidulus]|uniref:JAB domain-containing protein n=1 Tax=Wolbachia endosymbiont (group A) of Pogonocherus hispidulus TaxID=3066136 RepID=UPI00333F735D